MRTTAKLQNGLLSVQQPSTEGKESDSLRSCTCCSGSAVLPPKAIYRMPDDVLAPAETTDDNANEWFRDIRVTKSFLERCETEVFDASDLRSLDGKYFSNVFRG